MRKLLVLFTMLAFFITCSDDDDKIMSYPLKDLRFPSSRIL